MAEPTKEEIHAAADKAKTIMGRLQEIHPDPDPLALAILGAAMIHNALELNDLDLFFWMKRIVDPHALPDTIYQPKHERSLAITKLAIEAGVLQPGELSVVVLANKEGDLDMTTQAPSAEIAARAPEVMYMASIAAHSMKLRASARIPKGKA